MRTIATRITVTAGLLIALPLGIATTAGASTEPAAEQAGIVPIVESDDSSGRAGFGDLLPIAIGGAVIGAAAGATTLVRRSAQR